MYNTTRTSWVMCLHFHKVKNQDWNLQKSFNFCIISFTRLLEDQMSHFFVWQGHTSKIPYVSVISVIFRRTFMTTDKTYVLKGRTSNKWSRNIVSHCHSASFVVKTSSSTHSTCRAQVLHHTSATSKHQSSTFSSLNPGLMGYRWISLISYQ